MTNKEIVQQINEAFNSNDLNTFLDHCADNVQWTMPGKPAMTGKQAISDFMGKMDPTHPMVIQTESIIAEDELVACNGSMSMQHEGGSPYRGAFCDVYRFEASKVASLTSYVIDLK